MTLDETPGRPWPAGALGTESAVSRMYASTAEFVLASIQKSFVLLVE